MIPLITELSSPIILKKKMRQSKRKTTAKAWVRSGGHRKTKAKKKKIGSHPVQAARATKTLMKSVAPKRGPPLSPLIHTPQPTPMKLLPTKSIRVNPRPNSPAFARPIEFLRRKESPPIIKYIVERLHSLHNMHFLVGDVVFRVDMLSSMHDGKVRNIILDEHSSQCCDICQSSPKLFKGAFFGQRLMPVLS